MGGMTREELRSAKLVEAMLSEAMIREVERSALTASPGAVIAILGVIAEGVARAAEMAHTPVTPEDIVDTAGYLRLLRTVRTGR